MTYESWRITFQSSEQAARSAYEGRERARDALGKILNMPNYSDGADWDEIEEARKIAADALGLEVPDPVWVERD